MMLTTLFAVTRATVRIHPSVAANAQCGALGLRQGCAAIAPVRARQVQMAVKTGIVGLPNVGKSTLFNALMQESQAQAANFPFCTIEPNTGVVAVPDPKIAKLSEINKSVKSVPTSLSFVDIAGLVAGASKGEGLGNQFLANIRECDAIVHVVRCFDDENIIHVSGSVDALRDIEVISLELVLADLAQVERRLLKASKEVKQGKTKPEELSALEKLQKLFDEGVPARQGDLSEAEWDSVKSLGLLSAKPVIYAANVEDGDLAGGNDMVKAVEKHAATEGASVVVVSAQVESELSWGTGRYLRLHADTYGYTPIPTIARRYLLLHDALLRAGGVGAGGAGRRGAFLLPRGAGRREGPDRPREADRAGGQ